MTFQSLALQTDLIFNRFSGQVFNNKHYTAIKTPAHPDYFWGNYLIFPQAPQKEDRQLWLNAYENEFGPPEKQGFIALTWDSPQKGTVQPFLDWGFELQRSDILCARPETLNKGRFNSELTIRPLISKTDWQAYQHVHFDPDWPYGSAEQQKQFLDRSCSELYDMVQTGIGMRFGAFFGTECVGELGVYWQGNVGRFNTVGTHPKFRRRGVCSTLVYSVSQQMFQRGLETLVIEADQEEAAGRIYRSLGYQLSEQHYGLQWHDSKRFS